MQPIEGTSVGGSRLSDPSPPWFAGPYDAGYAVMRIPGDVQDETRAWMLECQLAVTAVGIGTLPPQH